MHLLSIHEWWFFDGKIWLTHGKSKVQLPIHGCFNLWYMYRTVKVPAVYIWNGLKWVDYMQLIAKPTGHPRCISSSPPRVLSLGCCVGNWNQWLAAKEKQVLRFYMKNTTLDVWNLVEKVGQQKKTHPVCETYECPELVGQTNAVTRQNLGPLLKVEHQI